MAGNPNWEKTGTVAGYAAYLRKSADALVVLVIRPNDAALAVDAELKPGDVAEVIALRLPELVEDLRQARAEKRAKGEVGRLNWEDIGQ
jgi:hypothetical protein